VSNETVCAVKYGKNGGELYSLGMDGFLRKWSTSSGSSLGTVSVFSNRNRPKTFGIRTETHSFALMDVAITIMRWVMPTFCITEDTNPSIAIVPGDKSWKLIDLKEMSVRSKLLSNMRNHNAVVYDSANHTLFSGGDVLNVYKPANAYKEWCAEVRQPSAQKKSLIDMSDL